MGTDTLGHLAEPKVMCPHCWHSFYGDQALYISQHPELYGDQVLGDSHKRRFGLAEARRDRDGRVLDPKGWHMVERACPRCRLQVAAELLQERPWFVSIAGAPRAGKTYLLTSMLHFLRKELAAQFNYSLDISDSHDVQSYVDYVNKLFHSQDSRQLTYLEKTTEDMLINRVTLDGAEVLLPKPFIFHLRSIDPGKPKPRQDRPRRRSIVLYDNPGESFELRFDPHAGQHRHTEHLSASDAVMFVFDPLLEASAREPLKRVSSDPQLSRLAPQRQEHTLSAVINRIRRYRNLVDGTRIEIPLAICVQKYDAWNGLLPFRKLIDHTSVVGFRDQGVAALDVEEINSISLLVRGLLEDLCPEFVATAEANFSLVRYFPVSALGASPLVDGELMKIRPEQIQPFRVTHPLLWLLQRWGLVFRTKRPRDNPRCLPEAQIQPVSPTRVRVLTPTGDSLSLDQEYAGSSIINPVDGQGLWIPKLPEPAMSASPQALRRPKQPPSPSVHDDLRLKLDDRPPEPPEKKGWFNW